jgi:thiol-disulfide isomerase/thioredoxin/DNA-binding beta-propeller fold protein YncE
MFKHRTALSALCCASLLWWACAPVPSPGQTSPAPDPDASPAAPPPDAPPKGAFTDLQAPPFPADLPWLNTDKPLSLQALRGHVVLVDFWTYCCINCMHILPDLAWLERKYAAEPFVVVGVHSGKFDGERDPERIREAIDRYDIAHPVVVDSDFKIWRAWGVDAWPTLAVIDAEGFLVDATSGEPTREWLDTTVQKALDAGRERKTLAAARIQINRPPRQDTPLSYPGKVISADGDRLLIADSGHHRVVIASASTGQVLDTIGSGLMGAFDGPFETASFHNPQGMALRGDTLYIADTNNHLIRAADLKARVVTTIAGDGSKGAGPLRGSSPAKATALRSPWDLLLDGDALYVAMAGSHQLWRLDLAKDVIERFAGSGRESIDDGDAADASFSQPSGLARIDRTLYVADSETSAIRAVDLDSGHVTTLIGKGLFDFGDIDGASDTARLQHVIGIAAVGDALYLADTYNHKIKRLDPNTRTVTTVAGGDKADLFEPAGITALGDTLYIADTNNHRLRALNPKTGALTDLPLAGLRAPALQGVSGASQNPDLLDGSRRVEPLAALSGGSSQTSAPISVTGGVKGDGRFIIAPVLPDGYSFTEGAPFRLQLDAAKATGVTLAQPDVAGIYQAEEDFPLSLPLSVAADAQGTLKASLSLYYCSTGERKVCIPARLQFQVDVPSQLVGDGAEVAITYRVPEIKR